MERAERRGTTMPRNIWNRGTERMCGRDRKRGTKRERERSYYGLDGTSLMRPAASCRNRVVTEAMKAPSPPPPVRQ